MTDVKTCQQCLSEIPAQATKCRHCGSDPRPAIDRTYLIRATKYLIGGIVIAIAFGLDDTDSSLANVMQGLGTVMAVLAGLYVAYELIYPSRPSPDQDEEHQEPGGVG